MEFFIVDFTQFIWFLFYFQIVGKQQAAKDKLRPSASAYLGLNIRKSQTKDKNHFENFPVR